MSRIRWGVLGTARIATEKVIPAMQRGRWSTTTAIASRDLARAREAAGALGIPKAYGSYEALLDDPDIDAVYNPLPNHLHVPWTVRAAERGKHVLCEKPIAMSAAEARSLLDVRDRTGVRIQEAFMVRTHPQWLTAREIARSGRLGEVRSMLGYFSYYNDDPANIRNIPEFGGGGVMDIGCYLINTARFIFDREPQRVIGLIDRDQRLNVDRLASMLLDFGGAHTVGTCSTQMAPYQRMQILGTRGRIEIQIPFNAPPDRPCRVLVDPEGDLSGRAIETIELDTCDQYTIQGDLFSKALLDGTDVPVPLEDAVRNMECIEAIFRSAKSGRWEVPRGAPVAT
ncbi:MAG: Gfo/Idh/MocA family oxidoreductase [Vicinamibacterales bacterium]